MCDHNSTIGDNYGVTCADCGQVLSGYGYWGEGSTTCQHEYLPDGNGNLVCLYCEDFIANGDPQAAQK